MVINSHSPISVRQIRKLFAYNKLPPLLLIDHSQLGSSLICIVANRWQVSICYGENDDIVLSLNLHKNVDLVIFTFSGQTVLA